MHGSFKWKHLKNGVWRVLLKPQSHRCFQNGTPKFRSRDWKSHTENWRFGYCAGLHRWENSWLRTKHIPHFHGIWTHHIKKVVKCCWVFPFHFLSGPLAFGLKARAPCLFIFWCWYFGGWEEQMPYYRPPFSGLLCEEKKGSHHKGHLLFYANRKERWRAYHGSWPSLVHGKGYVFKTKRKRLQWWPRATRNIDAY